MRWTSALPVIVVAALVVGGGGCGAPEGTLRACYLPASCPGVDTECVFRACLDHACAMTQLPAGTVLPSQVTGDCLSRQCDAAGTTVQVPDDGDVPYVVPNTCLEGHCAGGAPGTVPRPVYTACADPDPGYCDGAGGCVQCLSDAECPPPRTCVQGRCG